DFLVSADTEGQLHVWRTGDRTLARVLTGHTRLTHVPPWGWPTVGGLAVAPDRPEELVSAGLDGTLRVWDLATGRLGRQVADQPRADLLTVAVESAALPGRGRLLLTGDGAGALVWRSFDTLEVVHREAGHDGAAQVVCCRPDGGQWASAGADGRIRLWDH